MADGNFNASVTFTATPDQVVTALAQIQAKLDATSTAADQTHESVKQIGKGAEEAEGLTTESLMAMALGFGTIAGAAEKAGEMIVEGLKKAAEFIPESIEATNKQAIAFEGLEFQTGENLHQLDVYDATMKLVGGTMDDLTGWLRGVTMAMRTHSAAFIENGVAANEDALMAMKPIDVMQKSIEIITHCTDANRRLTLEQEMLGRAGVAQVPLMKRFFDTLAEGAEVQTKYGKDTTQAMLDTAHAAETTEGILAVKIEAMEKETAGSWKFLTNVFAFVNESGLFVAQSVGDGVGRIIGWFSSLNSACTPVINSIEKFLGLLHEVKQAGPGLADTEKKEAEEAGAYQRHMGPSTEEEIKARQKGQEEFDKAQAARATTDLTAQNAAIAVRNALIDQGRSLQQKLLEAQEATTAEAKKQREYALAANALEDARQKITDEVAKAPGDKGVQAQAKADRLAAERVYAAQMVKIDDDAEQARLKTQQQYESEVTAGTLEHQKALLETQLEQINADKAMHRISDEDAATAAQAIADRVYQIEMQALNEKSKLYQDDLVELQKILNQMTAITDKYEKDKVTASIKGESEWQKEQKSAMDTVANETARGLNSMLTGHQTFAKALASTWQGISSSIIEELTRIEIKQVMSAAVQSAAGKAALAGKVADTGADVALDQVQASGAETSMAAKIYAWYAGMGPWAIPAAAATVAAVMAAIGKISGREKGGDVTAGTPYIVGEAGHELFVPGVSGTILPHDMTRSLMQANASTQRTVSNYDRLGASYASTARDAVANGQGDVHADFRGAIFASTTEGQRAFDKAWNASAQRVGRSQG